MLTWLLLFKDIVDNDELTLLYYYFIKSEAYINNKNFVLILTPAVSINVIFAAIKIPQGIACCCKLSKKQRRHLTDIEARP